METSEEIKKTVQEEYGKRAREFRGCSSSSCISEKDYGIVGKEYIALKGYNPDADLGAGCGLPTKFAAIKEGDTVVDLGSGAGNDCFIARSITGDTGKIIGIDMTREMVERATQNAEKFGYGNMEFIQGEIENIPLQSEIADVVVSNCVMNLVPDKAKAFAEVYRILKPGAHFSISDIVYSGNMPESIKNSEVLYVKCLAGSLPKDDYIEVIKTNGFKNVRIDKQQALKNPEALLAEYLTPSEIKEYQDSDLEVYSITVYAEKPAV